MDGGLLPGISIPLMADVEYLLLSNQIRKIMPTYKAQMKLLIADLRFAQMQYRMAISSVKSARKMVHRIADKMKKLQREK